MNRFLQLAIAFCVICPLNAGTGQRFWTRSEAVLKQGAEGRLDIQIRAARTPFHLRLQENQEGTSVSVSDGKSSRFIGLAGPLVQPGSFGWFCIREHEGESQEGDISLSLSEPPPEGLITIPVGRVEVGEWVLWLVQWDTGACGIGGLFSSHFILAQHRPTGTWTARVGVGTGFRELPSKQSEDPEFVFVPAKRTSNNCWVNTPWHFQVHRGQARVVTGAKSYRWFCSTTIAETPRHARHWGHQEVAWHVVSTDAHGGVAQAFDISPRAKSDFDGILPTPGTVPFRWRTLVVAGGKDGRRRFIDSREAKDLARTGHWDVVLERCNGTPMATWLVEHERDFPHSTPAR